MKALSRLATGTRTALSTGAVSFGQHCSMKRRPLAVTCLGLAIMLVPGMAMAQYHQTNLVSNQVKHAVHTDPLLVNAWGVVHRPGSPWWVNDNNSGWSTLYDGSGNLVTTLKVLIPTAGNGPSSPTGLNGPGMPTGIAANASNDFQIQGSPSNFLFATLDGTISGWAPQANRNEAILMVDNSADKAVYTGLAITSRASSNLLYAADQANGKVDMYDASFTFVKSFTDTTVPEGFAPFGVQDINGLLYVTYADVKGGSGGFVDLFQGGWDVSEDLDPWCTAESTMGSCVGASAVRYAEQHAACVEQYEYGHDQRLQRDERVVCGHDDRRGWGSDSHRPVVGDRIWRRARKEWGPESVVLRRRAEQQSGRDVRGDCLQSATVGAG